MIWLIKNIKLVSFATICLLVIGAVFYVAHLQSALEKAKEEGRKNLKAFLECEHNQTAAYEASDEYQKNLTALNKRVSDLKRLRTSKCLPVTPGGSDAETGGGYDGKNGITSDALYDYAQECESIRLQLRGLQDFIK